MSTAGITSGTPALAPYSPEVLTNLKTAVQGLEAAYATADPAKIQEATAAMSQALESAKQAGAVMEAPDETSPGDAAKAARTMASFPQALLQADIFSMMKLFQGMEREERNSARMDREVSLQTKVTELNSQATEMETAAEKRFTSAMISGSMQIVGGAMSVGMAGAGAYKQVQGIRSEARGLGAMNREQVDLTTKWETGGKVGPKPVVEDNSHGQVYVTIGKTQTASGMAMGQSAGGLGQMASGIGGMVAAAFDKEAAAADVAAKRNETNATVADTAIQAANDRMQRAKEIIDDMKEKISAMEQSNIETNKGIARNV
jgi:hypothetical protein